MPPTDLYQLVADKTGCQRTDIANLNLYPGGRLVVKLKSGQLYDFQASRADGAPLVPAGRPFHIRDATGILLAESAPVDPAAGPLGRLFKLPSNPRRAFGIRLPAAGDNPGSGVNLDQHQGNAGPYPRARPVTLPLVNKNQVTKTLAHIKSAPGAQPSMDGVTPPVHGQAEELTPQVEVAQQAVAAAKSRKRPAAGASSTPTEQAPT